MQFTCGHGPRLTFGSMQMTPDEENIFSRIASYMGAEQNDKNDEDHEPM